jgi:low temperature requirement protein LtrA
VGELQAEREQRVTPLELFFDLVFVFAFTQVTTVLSDNPTWNGLGHGLLILGVLWWAWAAYAWLTNTVDPEVGAVWGAMLVAMAAMFGAALTVPDAFGAHGVLFGVAFLIVNVMHLTLYALGARGDPDLLAAILRVAPSSLVGAALILVAGFADGGLKPLLWLAALVVGYRAAPRRDGRLARAAGALRRASRPDRDHRDRRVPDRHRPRRERQRLGTG